MQLILKQIKTTLKLPSTIKNDGIKEGFLIMMYVFICPKCKATRMVSLMRRLECQCCASPMANCEMDYVEWIHLTKDQREMIVEMYHNAEDDKLCFTRPLPFYDRWERNYYL